MSPTVEHLTSLYDISAADAATLAAFGFDAATFDGLRAELAATGIDPTRNWVTGVVEPPTDDDLAVLPAPGTDENAELAALGAEAIGAGRVGVVLLAGGMATRFGGGVKALADVLPGLRFVDVKLRDVAHAGRATGVRIPMMLMTSFQSHDALGEIAEASSDEHVAVSCVPQAVSLRVTEDGEVYRDADGHASLYAPGHGDLPDALRNSGALDRFTAAGGDLLFVTNVDNAAATLDPAVIGLHLREGRPLTCEVTDAQGAIAGGAPYRVDGHLQVLESFRIPDHVDTVDPVALNTNSLVIGTDHVRAEAPLTWFQVTKNVNGDAVVQFERLVGELSAFMPTTMAYVEREGRNSRFLPVKDRDELAQRQPAVREVLAARGLL